MCPRFPPARYARPAVFLPHGTHHKVRSRAGAPAAATCYPPVGHQPGPDGPGWDASGGGSPSLHSPRRPPAKDRGRDFFPRSRALRPAALFPSPRSQSSAVPRSRGLAQGPDEAQPDEAAREGSGGQRSGDLADTNNAPTTLRKDAPHRHAVRDTPAETLPPTGTYIHLLLSAGASLSPMRGPSAVPVDGIYGMATRGRSRIAAQPLATVRARTSHSAISEEAGDHSGLGGSSPSHDHESARAANRSRLLNPASQTRRLAPLHLTRSGVAR